MRPQQQGSKSPIPTAVSSWTQDTPDSLNAKYNRYVSTPFDFERLALPDELKKSITRFVGSAKYSRRPGSRGSCKCQQLEFYNLMIQLHENLTSFNRAIQSILSTFDSSAQQ